MSGNQDEDVRLAATAIDIQNHRYVVELVQPVTMGERSLARFGRMLMLVIPLALVLATLGGYWLSGRALAPVTQITHDARRINATNLSDRLAVPPAHDELRELSETLNAMLGRIDQSVSQLRQFTADASHELRAPLALIYTAAEFSLRRERPREELVDALEKILRESRHTTSLVDSLLLLARADSGEDGLQAAGADQSVGALSGRCGSRRRARVRQRHFASRPISDPRRSSWMAMKPRSVDCC